MAQADNDLVVAGSAFAYWQSEAVYMAESFTQAIGQVEEWQRIYNASARNRNAVCKGLAKFLRDSADRFEEGEPVSCEGLEKLNGVSHLIALEAQKVAASRSADLDRTLGEVEREMPRLKRARLEPKEEPVDEITVQGSVWNLVNTQGTGSTGADVPMGEGVTNDSS